jgi:hypothetical protein
VRKSRLQKRISLPGGILVNVTYLVIDLPELRALDPAAVSGAKVLNIADVGG